MSARRILLCINTPVPGAALAGMGGDLPLSTEYADGRVLDEAHLTDIALRNIDSRVSVRMRGCRARARDTRITAHARVCANPARNSVIV